MKMNRAINNFNRRHFLGSSLSYLGALSYLTNVQSGIGQNMLQLPGRHFPSKVKSVIHLYMEGGPSQVDTFDYKPELNNYAGKPLPFRKPATVFNSSNIVMPSPFEFKRFGQTGSWVSSLFPHLATVVDDLTFIHSVHHTISNHSAACYMTHTGHSMAGRPCMGSWIYFGCGTENNDLPGFVVLDCGQGPSGGSPTWSNGFLPQRYGGIKFNKGETPVSFLEKLDPTKKIQDLKLNAIDALNLSWETSISHSQSAIEKYKKANSMQKLIPELVSVSNESASMQKLYGMDDAVTSDFGSRCLIARRLVEAGVRHIEIFSPRVKADRWDQHGGLKQGHIRNSAAVDKPIAGLIKDLKSRGLLDETLIVWGGEFGRTPSSQGSSGRDHNPFGYTVFLAGAGVQSGVHHGSTDAFGYYAQSNKVHIHDLHASILHLMGLDHEKLTYRFGGRDYRLTDVEGRIIHPILS